MITVLDFLGHFEVGTWIDLVLRDKYGGFFKRIEYQYEWQYKGPYLGNYYVTIAISSAENHIYVEGKEIILG